MLCSWGRYELNLFAAGGGWLPPAHLDLRHVARDVTRGAIGRLVDYRETIGHASDDGAGSAGLARVPGRAGDKLRAIGDVIASFVAIQNAARAGCTPLASMSG